MDDIENENHTSSRTIVDDGGKKISIKFLIANSHAGSLIGKKLTFIHFILLLIYHEL